MRNNRGSVLIFSYLLVAAMVAWGSAMALRTIAEQNTSSRSVRLASAFQTAEAGLDQALVELRADSDWDGASAAQVPNGGSYDVAVTDGDDSTLKILTITGHYPSTDPTAPGYQRRQVEAIVQISSTSVFQYGLLGDEEVEIKKKVTTDSYNSDLGSYASQTPGANGDVATNNTEEESVSLAKDTTINGQVGVGPDMADPSTAVKLDKNVTITGNPQAVSMEQTMELPSVTAPAVCSGGDVTIDKSKTLALAEASSPYCYGKLTLKDSATLTVSGNVMVYVSELTIDKDSKINEAGKPTQLLFEVTSNKEVKVKNTGLFVGAIYAPLSTVNIDKSGDFYGAAVGNEIEIDKECKIHYDEALSNVGPTSGDSDALLVSWREL